MGALRIEVASNSDEGTAFVCIVMGGVFMGTGILSRYLSSRKNSIVQVLDATETTAIETVGKECVSTGSKGYYEISARSAALQPGDRSSYIGQPQDSIPICIGRTVTTEIRVEYVWKPKRELNSQGQMVDSDSEGEWTTEENEYPKSEQAIGSGLLLLSTKLYDRRVSDWHRQAELNGLVLEWEKISHPLDKLRKAHMSQRVYLDLRDQKDRAQLQLLDVEAKFGEKSAEFFEAKKGFLKLEMTVNNAKEDAVGLAKQRKASSESFLEELKDNFVAKESGVLNMIENANAQTTLLIESLNKVDDDNVPHAWDMCCRELKSAREELRAIKERYLKDTKLLLNEDYIKVSLTLTLTLTLTLIGGLHQSVPTMR